VLADLPFLDEIPLHGVVGPGHIAIDIAPKGARPLPLLLDTGADWPLMTPGYARRMSVTVRRAKEDPYRKATVLGRDLLFFVDTSSSDTGDARSGMRVGLLGGEFLKDFVVEVDYRKARVRFLDPKVRPVSEETAEPGEVVLPVRLIDRRPSVEIHLGTGSAWFLMDTGSPTDLGLSEEKARELGFTIEPGAETAQGLNLWGTDRWAMLRAPKAHLGELELEDVGLEVAVRAGSSWRVTHFVGPDEAFLGNAFMSRFRVRFDYPHQRVALLPVPAPPPVLDVVPERPGEEPPAPRPERY
jgi:hypothetical protein